MKKDVDLFALLRSLAEDEFLVQWIIALLLLFLLLYLLLPRIIRIFNTVRNKVNYGEDLIVKVENHDIALKEIDKKLGRDYAAINDMREMMNRQKKVEEDSLEERELIMKSILAVLKGLQELGSNGPTKIAQEEIEAYINKQAHEPRI